jgi:electron transport complex protein RnfG
MPRQLLTLGLIGLVAAATLAGVDLATRERIELQEQRRALEVLHQVVPEDSYDNELVQDRFSAWIAGLAAPATVYRARRDDQPVALLADVTTPDGYSGEIRLIVGLRPDGELISVRVISHRETPGLGDKIERERSDWIEQFAGKRVGAPPLDAWKPDRRGGSFDTLSSATITSSAVIGAVQKVLSWYAANSDRAYDIPAESK